MRRLDWLTGECALEDIFLTSFWRRQEQLGPDRYVHYKKNRFGFSQKAVFGGLNHARASSESMGIFLLIYLMNHL
jgi:hypothetical protein